MRAFNHRRWAVRVAPLGRGVALALIVASVAAAQEPRPLAGRFPAADLNLYAEFSGLDAQGAAWKGSAAYKSLNETPFGALLEDLAAQGIDLAMKRPGPPPPSGAEVVRLLEQVARRGFAVGINGKMAGQVRHTVVIRGGSRPELSGTIDRLLALAGVNKATWKKVTTGSRSISFPNSRHALIDDGGDLVWCQAEEVGAALTATLAAIDGRGANATTHPLVAELGKADGTFRPAAFAFLDPALLPPVPPQAAASGLDGVKRVDFRWGFDGEVTQSVIRLIAPSPRRGFLSLLDGPTFDASTLPPLPAGLTGFTAASLSPADLYDKFVGVASEMDPRAAKEIAEGRAALDARLGINLREDVLGRLGPKISMFATTGGGGAIPANIVAIVEVKDPRALDEALGKLFDLANRSMKGQRPPDAPAPPEFRQLAPNGDRTGYQLFLPPGAVPAGPMAGIKPMLLIGKSALAIATSPEAAASALDVAEGKSPRWAPADAHVAVMDHLPKGLAFLNIDDPRASLPILVANLPGIVMGLNMAMSRPGANARGPAGPAIPLRVDPAKIPAPAELSKRLFPASTAVSVDAGGLTIVTRESLPSMTSPAMSGVAVALLLPAVQAAREAARRSQCVNNLKQMGLACHNYHSTNDRFPPAAILDKQGKPLLSWRVAILPFLEQQELYNKFKLDEPWDSPNNKPLLAEMPKVYTCPSHRNPVPTLTTYRTWTGAGTLFEDPKGPTIATIIDGTSNTLMIVESKEAVPWTRPDEMPVVPFDPANPGFLLGAGSDHPGGFNALFADGSVKFFKTTIKALTLRALITPAGGEVVSADSY